jgi:hypothetical protein
MEIEQIPITSLAFIIIIIINNNTNCNWWQKWWPEGLAGTAWEPSKLPNYVSITPPPKL